MSFGIILDILIMACGIYMIYWAVQMKREHKIPEMLVGKGFKIERAKDPEGFIKYTFPYTFGTGVILFGAGLIEALEVIAYTHPYLNSIISMILVVIIIIYGVILMKAQKKYLIGIK
jgi:hypothetical protein